MKTKESVPAGIGFLHVAFRKPLVKLVKRGWGGEGGGVKPFKAKKRKEICNHEFELNS